MENHDYSVPTKFSYLVIYIPLFRSFLLDGNISQPLFPLLTATLSYSVNSVRMYESVWNSTHQLNSIIEDNEEWEKVYDDDADDENNGTENGDNDPGNHSSYGQLNISNTLEQNSIIVTEQGPLINARLGILQYQSQVPKSSGLVLDVIMIECAVPVCVHP